MQRFAAGRGKLASKLESLAAWRPRFPPGRIEAVYLHWSGGDYGSSFPAYHYCIGLRGDGVGVARTNDLRANMRNVSSGGAYAAHTLGRNSFSAGIAALGMEGATPEDFGRYPLVPELIDGLCRVGAAIAAAYGIPVDRHHVLTHAEAAILDGYFGSGDDERWDIARLRPDPKPLVSQDALDAGDELRARIAAYAR